MRKLRQEIQIIFQDPYASLNPRQRVADIIMEPLLFHGIAKTKEEARERCMSILARVGLRPEQAGRYPHQFSGGQRQRLTIARALAGQPKILVLDDSASALDVATDAALRKAIRGLPWHPTTFIVSQRASSVMEADQILVMEDGCIVGKGKHEDLLRDNAIYQEIYYSQFPKERKEA